MTLKSSNDFQIALGTAEDAISYYPDQAQITDIAQSNFTREEIYSQGSGPTARSRTLIVSNAFTEGGTINSYATSGLVLLMLRNALGLPKAAPTTLSSPTRYSYSYNFASTFAKQTAYLWMKQNEGQLKKHSGSFTEVSFEIEPDSTIKAVGTWASESIADDTATFAAAYATESIPYVLTSSVTLQPLDSSGALTGTADPIDFSSCTLNILNNLSMIPTSSGRKLRNGLVDVNLNITKDQLNDTYFDASEAETAYEAVVTITGNSTNESTVIKFPVQIGEYTEERTRDSDIAETVVFQFAPDLKSGANKIEVTTIGLINSL